MDLVKCVLSRYKGRVVVPHPQLIEVAVRIMRDTLAPKRGLPCELKDRVEHRKEQGVYGSQHA